MQGQITRISELMIIIGVCVSNNPALSDTDSLPAPQYGVVYQYAVKSGAQDDVTTENKGEGEVTMPLHNSELDCKLFIFNVYVIMFGAMCAVGLVGNSLSFAVMQRDRGGSHGPATFLLQVMAVTDNSFLITAGFAQIFTAFTLFYDVTAHVLVAYTQAYVWPLVHITQLGTVWITVLISFNRFVAICLPFRAPTLCSFRRVRNQVLAMVLLICLYNLPRFCESRVVTEWNPSLNQSVQTARTTDFKDSVVYQILYENILYSLCVFLGPLALLVVFNSFLVRELLLAHRRQRERLAGIPRRGVAVKLKAEVSNGDATSKVLTSSGGGGGDGDDYDQNITLVMLVIVLVFLVCQTPAYINQVLYYVFGEREYACGKPYFYFYHVSNIVVSANSAVNFVVYCVFRRQFRRRLYNAVCSVSCTEAGRRRHTEARYDMQLLSGHCNTL